MFDMQHLLNSHLAAQGKEFTDSGFIASLFGAEPIEVTQQTESGLHGNEQQQFSSFMSRARATMPIDRFEMIDGALK